MEVLTMDEWYWLYHLEIWMELAECGKIKDANFNPDEEFKRRYNEYLNKHDDGGN